MPLPRASSVFPPLVGWLLGLSWAFYPLFLSGFNKVPGDAGDSRFNQYVLEHGYRWLAGEPGHEDLWGPPIFFPDTNTLAYSDCLFGALPFYAVWRGIGFGSDHSYSLWLITLATLNYGGMYLLLRRVLQVRPIAATAGAFLFAFGSSRLAQVGHPQLWPHFWSVGALWALLRLFEAPKPRGESSSPAGPSDPSSPAGLWLTVFVLCVVGQLYAGVYLGWFLILGLATAGLFAFFMPEARRRLVMLVREHYLALVVSMVGGLLLLWPFLDHYGQARRALGGRSFDQEVLDYLPLPQSWFYLGDNSWVYLPLGQLKPQPKDLGWIEHSIGIGLFTSAFALFGVLRRRDTVLGKLLLFTPLALALFATRWQIGGLDFSLWRLVHLAVPGADAVRAVPRIALAFLLPAAIGLAWFINDRPHAAAAWALFLLCALEQGHFMMTYDQEECRGDVRAIAAEVDPRTRAFFYAPETDQEIPLYRTQTDAMWAQLGSGMPTVNGWSGNVPPGWRLFNHQVRAPEDAARLKEELNEWLKANGVEPADVQWLQLRR